MLNAMTTTKEIQEQPLFFLFTCVKDGNDYIDKLFDSLLNQTKINFIHFIYEDGSSKPLGNKVIEYKNKAENLKNSYQVIYEYNPVNIGLNKSTQYCISKCTCPFFIWIDCDNYVDIHFFEELEKTYKKNKNVLMIRTVLHGADPSIDKPFSFVTLKNAKSKYQLGLLARGRHYYSFFAVNYEKYHLINPQNIFLPDRDFYNDEQIYVLCYVSNYKTSFSKRSTGYFTTREDQESVTYRVSPERIIELRIELCDKINNSFGKRIKAFYCIKELYDELYVASRINFHKTILIVKQIKRLSKENKISLKNYYKNHLTRYVLKSIYFGWKNKWNH